MFDIADDLMINQKQYAQAIPIYQDILKADPENVDALNSLAQCTKLSQQPPTQETFQKCRQLYQRALAIDPEDFETNFNLGVLLYEFRKDMDKAIHYFKVAIQEEANPTALFNLAVIYEEKGDRIEAKKTY